MTTRSCGLGLNLAAADTVIFLEHDWNPFSDLQAMDRAHRIGQKNPVTVYRILSESTIEARISGLQLLKQKIFQHVIHGVHRERKEQEQQSAAVVDSDSVTSANISASSSASVSASKNNTGGDSNFGAAADQLTMSESESESDRPSLWQSLLLSIATSSRSGGGSSRSGIFGTVGARVTTGGKMRSSIDTVNKSLQPRLQPSSLHVNNRSDMASPFVSAAQQSPR